MTLLTKKCFCLAMGFTAVHLVSSNFFGLNRFMNMSWVGQLDFYKAVH